MKITRKTSRLKSLIVASGKLCFLGLLLITVPCKAIPAPSKQNIIIDTDCAFDDFRAINILLSRPEINTCGIIASEGTLSASKGYERIRSMLHFWDKNSMPVACGTILNGTAPSWRELNSSISWGTEYAAESIQSIGELIHDLSGENLEYTLVCLGTLNTAATIANDYPGFFKKIKRIVWYTGSIHPLQGFNYEYDKNSAEQIVHSGSVRVDLVSNLHYSEAKFDMNMAAIADSAGTSLSSCISTACHQSEVKKKLLENHFGLCDDLVAVYLINPELFEMNSIMPEIWVRFCESYNIEAVREVIGDLFKGKYIHENNVAFYGFPAGREAFRYDVRPVVDSAIARYGNEEWKACVLTDEIHGHLGVFSIVGAKMGIKAREYFGVAPDQLSVISFAGTTPPYSCLNDGIQVSTGATLGQGTITIANDSITRPAAIFTYKGNSIKISLKDDYLKTVNDDISRGIVKFGLSDDGYWNYVRKTALRYWLEWDRNTIFNIEKP